MNLKLHLHQSGKRILTGIKHSCFRYLVDRLFQRETLGIDDNRSQKISWYCLQAKSIHTVLPKQ